MNSEILKKGYCVIEDFVPETIQNEIESLLTSKNFPWYYINEMVDKNFPLYKNNENITHTTGMVHMFAMKGNINSQYSDAFIFILKFLEKKYNFLVDELIRIRGRLTFQFPGHDENKYCAPHVDFNMNKDYYSLIYYVNDSDGDTFLFNESRNEIDLNCTKPTIRARIKPKKGNLLLFRGDIYHSGNNPINNTCRMIVNYDFTIK